ncbi:MAG: hypothetical protein ABIJ86_04475, partial [Spirochaetota bacterium]
CESSYTQRQNNVHYLHSIQSDNPWLSQPPSRYSMPASVNTRAGVSSQERTPISGATILVIEDEPILALELSEDLTKACYTVPTTINDGDRILAGVLKHKPDLIIMDIKFSVGVPLPAPFSPPGVCPGRCTDGQLHSGV